MNRFFVLLLLLPGCISIGTYEQQMKKCRDASVQAEQLKAQVSSLEANNQEMEKNLAEKSKQQERLQNEISDVRNTYDELVQQLKDDITEGDVGVKQTEAGLTITLGNKILFQSGKAELQAKGKKILMQVAGVIRKVKDHLIQVEGHTDNIRISGALKARFPSNWELSATRSAAVVRFLQETGKIGPSLLVLAAFAENHPIDDNSTPNGRQQNRRVEIKLIPKPQNPSSPTDRVKERSRTAPLIRNNDGAY